MKTPWLPPKPKHAARCKKCNGKGFILTFANFFSFKKETLSCPICGGKGFI